MPTQSGKNRPRIVVLDGHTLNPGDLSWNDLEELGQVSIYDRSEPAEVYERAREADIVLSNKVVLDADTIAALPQLACICVTASGYNNIDVEAARQSGILVCNAVGYGSESVAQHVFALLLELTNHVALHDRSVREGVWSRQPDFSYHLRPMIELAGKTMGIYGYGRIGRQVAGIAQAFGMQVLVNHHRPVRNAGSNIRFTDVDGLFAGSDVLSLHAPLTSDNAGLVDRQRLSLMKSTALLINTARGGLIDEEALLDALRNGRIAGAALDVLATEPPPADHPLFSLGNCLVTPHQAWATREARQRLLAITVDNIAAFLAGNPKNVVN